LDNFLILIDQFVLIAAEEGVYSLNLSELHDATLELVNKFNLSYC